MQRTITIKPAEGLSVRDPASNQRIPAEGATVPRTAYWLRRLNDGDVVEVPEQAADQAASQPKKAGKTAGGEQA